MARPAVVLGAVGLVLGGLGAVGWHFQPVTSGWFDAPRPLDQIPLAVHGDPYAGSVPRSAEPWWHLPWWPAIVALPVGGALVGAVLGAVLHRAGWQVVPAGSRSGTIAASGGTGLLVGVLSAVAWHVEPEYGGVWFGGSAWFVDVGHPLVGLVVGAAVGTAFGLRRDRPEKLSAAV